MTLPFPFSLPLPSFAVFMINVIGLVVGLLFLFYFKDAIQGNGKYGKSGDFSEENKEQEKEMKKRLKALKKWKK